MRITSLVAISGAAFFASGAVGLTADYQDNSTTGEAYTSPKKHFWSGDWYLKVGAAGMMAPRFTGSNSYTFSAVPLVSLGRAGEATRFSSRNDNVAFAFIDNRSFRAGVAGKLLFKRDDETADQLKGLKETKLGGEVGGFAEVYPTDWLRVRGEVRHGVRAHNGVVADQRRCFL